MTVLQWALLLVGAAAVIAIWWNSRRGGRSPQDQEVPDVAPGPSASPKAPAAGQMDIFRPAASGEFDEFGVGRPRKRTVPEMAETGGTRPLFPEAAPPPRSAPAKAEPPSRGTLARVEPEFIKAAPAKPVDEKIITLLIAEREGTAIFGKKIHQALGKQNLQFGERKIYHRLQNGEPLFSVASLIKPGFLDPEEQEDFSTPGLSVFILLPGPKDPVAVVQDMIGVAQGLAKLLNAEVFDAQRQPFTADSARALLDDVRDWAKRNR